MGERPKKEPCFGEIFITNNECEGGLEILNHFKGKSITSLGGGYKKLFILEDSNGNGNEGVVSSLHAPEYDEDDYTFNEGEREPPLNPSDLLNTFDNKGSLKKIISGKKNMVFLTEEGKLFSYGYGEYGTLGLGGICYSPIPKLITSLSDRIIEQIACGEHHTLALTNKKDLYAWGKGFEGQLGIRKDIETASTPKFVPFFYKNALKSISCGANHSLAITENGELYGWGEARLGQLGTGKKVKEVLPVLISLVDNKKEKENKDDSPSKIKIGDKDIDYSIDNIKNIEEIEYTVKINENKKVLDINLKTKVVMVSGGYGHTAAITNDGRLFTWGLNVKGQLGNGNNKTKYYPNLLLRDILDNDLPNFKYVHCGYFTTFAIDDQGKLYSWGGGNICQKNDFLQNLPRKVEAHTENRIFTEIFSTMNSTIFFAKLRVMSIRPYSGPSSGGTLLSLIGTGLTDTGKQSVRFSFGKYQSETSVQYDMTSDCFYCITPKFEDVTEDIINWPLDSKVEITLDGSSYQQCEQNYLIYSYKVSITSIFPRCASIQGGTLLSLTVPNLDDKTAASLNHLTVGFQSKISKKENDFFKTNNHPPPSRMPSQNVGEMKEKNNINKGAINPLDISISDPEVEKDNWICVRGIYNQGKITCVIPKIENYSEENLQFNVDLSLNGQQFSGQPSSFRFYDISISSMDPKNGSLIGGTNVKLEGKGFFDTVHKKIKFKSKYGERLIDIVWDKKEKCYNFVAPPISWLFGGNEPTQDLINEIKNDEIIVSLTLSGVEWINIGNFLYFDPEIERIAPFPPFEKDISEEDRNKKWNSEEKEISPFENCKNEIEIEKKKLELIKIKENEDIEISQFFKKAGSYLYLFGKNFLKINDIIVQFIYQNRGKNVKGVYKNDKKIGIIIPEMDDLPMGLHEIFVEISFNGQQFSNSKKSFKYIAFDKNMTLDQKNKYEDQEMKNLKKPPGKK